MNLKIIQTMFINSKVLKATPIEQEPSSRNILNDHSIFIDFKIIPLLVSALFNNQKEIIYV
jgi:hypothetical protein